MKKAKLYEEFVSYINEKKGTIHVAKANGDQWDRIQEIDNTLTNTENLAAKTEWNSQLSKYEFQQNLWTDDDRIIWHNIHKWKGGYYKWEDKMSVHILEEIRLGLDIMKKYNIKYEGIISAGKFWKYPTLAEHVKLLGTQYKKALSDLDGNVESIEHWAQFYPSPMWGKVSHDGETIKVEDVKKHSGDTLYWNTKTGKVRNSEKEYGPIVYDVRYFRDCMIQFGGDWQSGDIFWT